MFDMKPLLQPLLDFLKDASPDDIRQLAEVSRVSEYTIAKIKRGETKDPGVKTVEALVPFIKRRKVAA
jgi:transcriptional regulator with XRE-family HTH domain